MVTFAQAQERADEWVNGDVPAYQHREVRVREFELGFVVWAEDRADGPVSDGGRQRLVIARDSGEATLWPGLPVGEVIRRYEEEYGAQEVEPAAPAPPPERVDLNQTSFLLSPPEWLQEAADKLGIPDRRAERDDTPPPAPEAPSSFPPPAPIPSPSTPSQGGSVAYEPTASDGVPASSLQPPVGATPWAGTDVNGDSEDAEVALPATVFAPPLSGADDEEELPPVVPADAPTALMSGGSQLPKTAIAPSLGGERPPAGPPVPGPPVPGTAVPGPPVPGSVVPGPPVPGQHTPPPAQHTPPPGPPGGPGAGDIADAATSKAAIPPRAQRGGTPPPPPGAPGTPGARPGAPVPPPSGPGAPGAPAGGYVPTQLVSQLGPPGAPQPPGPPTPPPPGGVHQAATMFADPNASSGAGVPQPPGPPGVPGAPQPPGPPGPPGAPVGQQPPPPPGAMPPPGPGGVHHAATMLAGPAQAGPGAPQPPGPPMGAPPAYGYPQAPPGQPTVGPGYQAVLRFRAPDGSEQQLIRRSAPGTPHPEWQMLHELRAMNVPPQQVIELHTELESCELPGGYCARMIRETWPQVRITSVAPYGTDHASRQQGMQHLLTHQGELHQVADGPARPAPVRAPLPQMQPAPPVPPEALAEEMMQTFGPQGVLRFDQRAVSRQGVPELVARTLVWAGLPADFGPFFWAQPGQPVVPTLAELAAQRQVQPASDAGSYLVMGSDFGRAICVQYGTAHIVAVPVEAGPGGAPVPPQFVNTGLPEFVRCMALLGRMWRLRYGLNPEQAGRWTVDFQAQLVALDAAALASPESWWSVLLEQMWDGLI